MAKKEKKPEVKVEAPVAAPLAPVVESPKYTTFYIERIKGIWNFNLIQIQDDKVISKKSTECMNKDHALEKFKISFAQTYFLGK